MINHVKVSCIEKASVDRGEGVFISNHHFVETRLNTEDNMEKQKFIFVKQKGCPSFHTYE